MQVTGFDDETIALITELLLELAETYSDTTRLAARPHMDLASDVAFRETMSKQLVLGASGRARVVV